MAEIKIEEKKSPIWPWILLIIAIIAILIYIFAFDGDDDEIDDRQEDTTEQIIEEPEERQLAPNNSTVMAYVSFINEDPDSMGIDHEFTSEALSKLTNATRAMADEIGYDIQKDLEELRTHTNKVESDPFETTHAHSIREAAEILANALQNIQQEAFPDLSSEADEVENAATSIEADELTLNQKGDVNNFFSESADLLEKMNHN